MVFRSLARQKRAKRAVNARRNNSRTIAILCLSISLLAGNILRLEHRWFSATALQLTPTAYVTNPAVRATSRLAEVTAQTLPPSTPASSHASSAAIATKTAPTPSASLPAECSGSSYTLPSTLDLADTPPGLTTAVDTPAYYQVSASTIPGLRQAITQCPVRRATGEFHAVTGYRLSWQYLTTNTETNCRLYDVRVGLHISQLLPQFTPTNSVSSTVTSEWNRYAAALTSHENGHVIIDTDYAQRMTTALQNLVSLDCSALSAQARITIDSYVALLNTANELYDSQTAHGATQGATL